MENSIYRNYVGRQNKDILRRQDSQKNLKGKKVKVGPQAINKFRGRPSPAF